MPQHRLTAAAAKREQCNGGIELLRRESSLGCRRE
jgi:hypothetical protein